MNFLTKTLSSLTVTGLLIAALPLAASAYNVGVSNTIDQSIMSGHYCSTTKDHSEKNGSEWAYSKSSKNETGTMNGTTSGSVIDPASSSSKTEAGFGITAISEGGSNNTIDSTHDYEENVRGGSIVNTSLTHTVSAFASP